MTKLLLPLAIAVGLVNVGCESLEKGQGVKAKTQVVCTDQAAAKCKKDFTQPDTGYVIVGQAYCERCRRNPPPTIETDNTWVCKQPGSTENIPKDPGPFYPAAWVITAQIMSVFLPTRSDGQPNAWKIDKANLDIGQTMIVCKESTVPQGHTVVDENQDSSNCPARPDVDGKHQYNAKQIRRDK